MTTRVDKRDYSFRIEHMPHASIGIVYRNHGENKDITLRKVTDQRLIAFNGYARLHKNGDYLWSSTIIDFLSELNERDIKKNLFALAGSFECIIYDRDKIFLISDRFGSKKLFYALHNGTFIFAPDIGIIVDAAIIPKEKDLSATIQFLTSGFFIGDATLDKNIKRFPFGTLFERSLSPSLEDNFTRYWLPDPPIDKLNTIDEDLIRNFTTTAERSITSLVPLSDAILMPLSAGLDSRAIACFLSSNHKDLTGLTYNLHDEVKIAKAVGNQLQFKKHILISKTQIAKSEFREFLYDNIQENYSHSVLNQYFYTYFFKKLLRDQIDYECIYDGIYLGLLFSAPYTYEDFSFDRFQNIYCRGVNALSLFSSCLDAKQISESPRNAYENLISEFGLSDQRDGIKISTLFYLAGRLRRYVAESYHSREDYGYVFKPGFDYDLVDFGYRLGLPIRKGKLYREMYKKVFPDTYQITYKDSYGNRGKTLGEIIKSKYVSSRKKLNTATKGMIPYYSSQTEYFFYHRKELEKLEAYFSNKSYIPEIFSENDLRRLFELTKEKTYLLNFFQRVLMLQSFFKRFNY